VSDDDKIVSLSDKLRTKARAISLRRMLARTIREMKEAGANPAQIAQALREAADELEDDSG
jgi:hypothetical protein